MINKIRTITNTGILGNVSPASPDCDFGRYNLFYGFNGCGKTTLSRIFSSLANGEVVHHLPDEGTFKIELQDGMFISKNKNLAALKGQIAVFNTDYINENFRWEDGSVEAVFYLGKDQVEASEELQSEKLKRNVLSKDMDKASKSKLDSKDRLAEFKTETARFIDKKILERKYTSKNLTRDYENYQFAEVHVLDDDSLNRVESILGEINPPDKIEKLHLLVKFRDFIERARGCLQATSGTELLKDLSFHKSMVSWVKAGREYHEKNSLDDCLLCGNRIPEGRLNLLDQAIDDKFDKIAEQAKQLKNECNDIIKRINIALSDNRMTKISTIDSAGLKKSETSYSEILHEALSAVKTYEELIEKKLETPNVSVSLPNSFDTKDAEQVERKWVLAVSEMNRWIDEHNKGCDDFKQKKQEAENKLIQHHLAASNSKYLRLKDEFELAQKTECETRNSVVANDERIATLTNKIQNQGIAAEVISSLIRDYLLHDDVKLDVNNEGGGFRLRRSGKVIEGTLSEGEKTAIALCYFLASLEADGKESKDWIVVVDDPISSLDSRALNYAFNLLKSRLGSAKQLVILTHNINFMNECKKWLRRKPKKQFKLLYFDLKKVDGRRQGQIVPLPSLLSKFDSEYHFLFSKVLRFAETKGYLESEDHLLMPNAIRKVAEVFLTFKFSNVCGLSKKFDRLAEKCTELGIDAAMINAVERLVQVESHGDNLDDILSYSSMTIEETLAAARVMLEIMKKFDPDHYESVKSLCGKF